MQTHKNKHIIIQSHSLCFNGQVVANAIEIEQSERTTNTIHITAHKRGDQSLKLTFFPDKMSHQ